MVEDQIPAEEEFSGRDSGHAYRAVKAALWAFAVAFFVSMMINVGLALVIFRMFPLNKLEPFLLTVHPATEQVVEIESLRKNGEGIQILERAWVRQYVEYRETILPNSATMQQRAGTWVSRRSTNTVFERFRRTNLGTVKDAIARQVSRNVVVGAVTRTAPQAYVVEFSTEDFDRDGNSLRKKVKWRAVVEVLYSAFDVKRRTYEFGKADNPLGFKVIKYALSRAG